MKAKRPRGFLTLDRSEGAKDENRDLERKLA